MKRTALDPRLARRIGSGLWETRDRGADRTALLEERTRLLAQLDNPTPGTDLGAVATRAEEVATALDGIRVADEARARLAGAASDDGRGADDTAETRGVPGAGGAGGAGSPAAPEGRAGEHPAAIGHWARRFVESDSLTEMRARGNSGTAQIEIPGEVRAFLDTTQFGGPNTRVPGILLPQERPVRLIDLIDRQSFDSTSIEYVQEATFSDNAGIQTEGSAKAEATFTSTLKTATAATIANWMNITRQSASDNGQIMGYVEGRLARGLLRKVEQQILSGTGTGGEMTGILATVGRGTYAAPASEAAIISVRKAKTVAQLSEFEPDTVVMNPTGWQRIELSVDSQGMFRVTPNVQASMAPRIWGLTVVTTTVITALKAVVGSFLEGATLWEREGITVRLTDSHASNFTSNILTLLVEGRWALTVWRPAAYVEVTFDAAGA